MGVKITNGNTQVKYINIWVGKIHLSFTYYEAIKALWKTILAVIIVFRYLMPAYYKAEAVYYNVQKIPALIQSVDSTQNDFKKFRNTVDAAFKKQDSLNKAHQ